MVDMNQQTTNQKYVNKIKNVKCDICNKDITGYDLSNGNISDQVVLSHAVYHIRKHYREELPADINKFMIIESKEEEEKEPQPPQQQQVKPKNNNKKVKVEPKQQQQKEKEEEERVKCKLCGETSIAFTFEESMREHLENFHRISEIIDLPTEWFYEGVSA
jgi:hypothetical protein